MLCHRRGEDRGVVVGDHREGPAHGVAVGILGGEGEDEIEIVFGVGEGMVEIVDQREAVAAGVVVVEGGVEHHAGRVRRGRNDVAGVGNQRRVVGEQHEVYRKPVGGEAGKSGLGGVEGDGAVAGGADESVVVGIVGAPGNVEAVARGEHDAGQIARIGVVLR